MEKTNDKKVLLSLRNVEVKFNVRGRILTAIRNVSLDVYENESLAIVGESGSGKSVLTKTFAGMLENNGFISNGTIILSDDEISETDVVVTPSKRRKLSMYQKMLNRYSVLERGAKEKNEIIEKKNAIKAACTVNEEEAAEYSVKIKKLTDTIVDRNNYMQTLDRYLSSGCFFTAPFCFPGAYDGSPLRYICPASGVIPFSRSNSSTVTKQYPFCWNASTICKAASTEVG